MNDAGNFPMLSALVLIKYWEIIADNLSKAGWSWGCQSYDFQGFGA
jgi:hypothetical protein